MTHLDTVDPEQLQRLAARGLFPGAERSEILNHKGEVIAQQYREQIPPAYVASDHSGIRRRDRRKARK